METTMMVVAGVDMMVVPWWDGGEWGCDGVGRREKKARGRRRKERKKLCKKLRGVILVF